MIVVGLEPAVAVVGLALFVADTFTGVGSVEGVTKHKAGRGKAKQVK